MKTKYIIDREYCSINRWLIVVHNHVGNNQIQIIENQKTENNKLLNHDSEKHVTNPVRFWR